MKTYDCIVCGKTVRKGNTMGKYCSNVCCGKAKFTKTIERAKKGNVAERNTLRKVITELNGYFCAICGISEYNNKPLTLQVDHINGRADNNSLDNLRLLCPNCHAQSPYFSGANKGQGRRALGIKRN